MLKIAALVLSLCAQQAFCAANLANIRGPVSVRAQGSSMAKPVFSVPRKLRGGDRISTGEAGEALIDFSDGAIVRLGANSAFVVEKASSKEATSLLRVGSLRAWVRKGDKRRFMIRTPTAVCGVRGTQFAVRVAPSGRTTIDLLRGGLAVRDRHGRVVRMREGERLVVGPDGVEGKARKTTLFPIGPPDTEPETDADLGGGGEDVAIGDTGWQVTTPNGYVSDSKSGSKVIYWKTARAIQVGAGIIRQSQDLWVHDYSWMPHSDCTGRQLGQRCRDIQVKQRVRPARTTIRGRPAHKLTCRNPQGRELHETMLILPGQGCIQVFGRVQHGQLGDAGHRSIALKAYRSLVNSLKPGRPAPRRKRRKPRKKERGKGRKKGSPKVPLFR